MAWKICENKTKRKRVKKDDFSITVTVVGKAQDITRISFSDEILTQEKVARLPEGIANKKLLIYQNEETQEIAFSFAEKEPEGVKGIDLLGKNHGLANITIPEIAQLLQSFSSDGKKVKIPLQKIEEEGQFLWVLKEDATPDCTDVCTK